MLLSSSLSLSYISFVRIQLALLGSAWHMLEPPSLVLMTRGQTSNPQMRVQALRLCGYNLYFLIVQERVLQSLRIEGSDPSEFPIFFFWGGGSYLYEFQNGGGSNLSELHLNNNFQQIFTGNISFQNSVLCKKKRWEIHINCFWGYIWSIWELKCIFIETVQLLYSS